MTILSQQRLLLGLAAFFAAGSVAIVYWSLARIESGAIVPNDENHAGFMARVAEVQEQTAIDGTLATRLLRGPMVEKPPPKAPQLSTVKTRAKTKPVLKSPSDFGPRLKLVGTVIDSDSPVAIFLDSRGKSDAKGVGDQLELTPAGVTIQSIQSEQVTLLYQGRPLVVSLSKSSAAAASSRRSGPPTTKRRVNGRGRGQ